MMPRPDPYALLPPAYHTSPPRAVTLGPLVGKTCREANYAPDPEQQLILDDVFAYGPDGLPAAFEYGVIGPRQQLKTGTLIMCAIGWLFVVPVGHVRNVNWNAHLKETAIKSFHELAEVIKAAPNLRGKLLDDRSGGIHTGKDVEKILTADGRQLDVSARTERAGRGLTGDRIVLDEALYLTDAMLGALMPTLTARRDAQAVYASTPGLAGSSTLRAKRDAGRAGRSTSLGWAEWGTERPKCAHDDDRTGRKCLHFPPGNPLHVPGCAMDDEELWARASPLLGRVRPNGTGLSLDRMRNLRESIPPAEWGREYLGWWDEADATDVFGDGVWSAATARYFDADDNEHIGLPTPADFDLNTVGVAVAADLTSAAIVGAGPRGERTACRVVATGPGFQWLVPRLKELMDERPRTRVVYDPGGPSGVLTAELEKAVKPSRRLIKATFPQWKAACAGLWDGVRSGTVEHGGQPELDASVSEAKKRDIVDRWVWERYGYDASPLEAATLAVWGVTNVARASAYETGRVLTV